MWNRDVFLRNLNHSSFFIKYDRNIFINRFLRIGFNFLHLFHHLFMMFNLFHWGLLDELLKLFFLFMPLLILLLDFIFIIFIFIIKTFWRVKLFFTFFFCVLSFFFIFIFWWARVFFFNVYRPILLKHLRFTYFTIWHLLDIPLNLK